MKILVSSCVMGRNVRWNGKNKHDKEIESWAKKLGFELVPVCPEHELYGTPRCSIKIVPVETEVKFVMQGRDITSELSKKAQHVRNRHKDVVGFIGIAKSPSCGQSVGVHGTGQMIKGHMHNGAPFPTTEINSMRTPRGRMLFLDRIVKYITMEGINEKRKKLDKE